MQNYIQYYNCVAKNTYNTIIASLQNNGVGNKN